MGIHNEPGSARLKLTLQELVKTILTQMLDKNDQDRNFVTFEKSDQIVLFMNNLGGLSMLELAGVTAEICKQLKSDYGMTPIRVISGTYLTSLNGLGFSASILKLADTGLGSGKSMLELLDAPAEAVGWAAPIPKSTWEDDNSATRDNTVSATGDAKGSNLTLDAESANKILKHGLKKMIAIEADLTKYDTITGDGDCGIGLQRGAEAVMKEMDSGQMPGDAVAYVNKLITVVENTMDGTSGAIYAIFLNALSHGLREQDSGSSKPVDPKIWAAALKSSLQALGKYTPAALGDRTLMDALIPFVNTLSDTSDVHAAAKAAQDGAEKTKSMKASLGRAVYVGEEHEWLGKVPDPGAWGLAELLNGMAEAC